MRRVLMAIVLLATAGCMTPRERARPLAELSIGLRRRLHHGKQRRDGRAALRPAQRDALLKRSGLPRRLAIRAYPMPQPDGWFADQPALLTIRLYYRSDRLSSNLRLAGESVWAYNPCTTHFLRTRRV